MSLYYEEELSLSEQRFLNLEILGLTIVLVAFLEAYIYFNNIPF